LDFGRNYNLPFLPFKALKKALQGVPTEIWELNMGNAIAAGRISWPEGAMEVTARYLTLFSIDNLTFILSPYIYKLSNHAVLPAFLYSRHLLDK
jgi:hypothetical protein